MPQGMLCITLRACLRQASVAVVPCRNDIRRQASFGLWIEPTVSAPGLAVFVIDSCSSRCDAAGDFYGCPKPGCFALVESSCLIMSKSSTSKMRVELGGMFGVPRWP